MNRLILDYFRRWSPVLALVAVLEFGLGWFIVNRPKDNFEFWGLMLAMWAGANLLVKDLKRGVVRADGGLPLSARQIGRSWWLATVAIPAIALAVLLFLGAGTFYHFHQKNIFPAERLAMAGLFNVAWLSAVFTCHFPAHGFAGSLWKLARGSFFSVLAMMMIFGGLIYFQDAPEKPFKCALLLGAGALLTVVSWFRAGQFVPGHTSFRITAPPYKDPRGQHRAPGGYGGISFLIRTTFVRTFLILAAMVAIMALVRHWQRQKLPQDMDIMLFAQMGSFMSCFFIFFLQPMLVLRHLRFLRTLPISATSLTAAMMSFAILPLMALGALVAGVAALTLGTPVAITILKSYVFILGPASLCVFFAVWRGAGIQGYALLLLTLFGFQLVPVWLQAILLHPRIPFIQTGTFVALCVLLAFLLTRRMLRHSSHAYRVQASSIGNLPWAMGS
jgi:uncharacterized membrane protein (UPF0136 family)